MGAYHTIEIGTRFDSFFSGSSVGQACLGSDPSDIGEYSNDPRVQAGAELLARQYSIAKRNRFFIRITDLDDYAISVLRDYADTDVDIMDDNIDCAWGDEKAEYRAERKSAAKVRDRCAAILQDAGWTITRDSYGFATWRPPTQGA